MKTITIAGNIGKDAEVRRTQDGNAVAGFTVAVTDRDKNTTWFDCSLWGKRGEGLAQYLTKGSKVVVSGDFSTREHNGKTYLSIRANDVTLMGKPQQQYGDVASGDQAPQGAPADLGDEIPFMMEWRA